MSTYLDLKLKKKGRNVDEAPVIVTLCTTPARELASEISFNWNPEDKHDEYGYWTVMSLDTLHAIQSFYQEKIEDLEETIANCIRQKSDYFELLPKAVNKENFELIEQRADDNDGTLRWATEEKDSLEHFLRMFTYAENLLEDNDQFEIVYYIG